MKTSLRTRTLPWRLEIISPGMVALVYGITCLFGVLLVPYVALTSMFGLALGAGSLILALAFAFLPLDPFQGMKRPHFCRREGTTTSDAKAPFLLSATYDPRSRRLAVMYVLASAALSGATFGLIELICRETKPDRPPIAQSKAIGAALAPLVLAANAGFAGLSRRVVRARDRIEQEWAPWPESVQFPGTWGEVVTSFFTGRLPEELQKPPRVP